MREYQRSRHSSSLHSIRVRIFLFIYFVDLYFYGWAEGPFFLWKLPTGTTQTIRALFIYVGKPVGSRSDFLGEWKAQFRTVNFVPETCLPFAQISSFDRKTATKAWKLSVGNIPSGKDRTTFSDVPLLPWNFPLDRHENSCSFTSRPEFPEPVSVQNECWWKAPVALRLLSNRILEAFCKAVNNSCWSLLYEKLKP